MKSNNFQKNIYSFEKLLKQSAQIGQKTLAISGTKSWHPLMIRYLLGTRDKVAIFDTNQIFHSFITALYIIILLLKNKGNILVVNTNPSFFPIFSFFRKKTLKIWLNGNNNVEALNYNIYYYNNKWIGGTLTNWKQLSKSVITFAKFSQRFSPFLLKNNIKFTEYEKMKKQFIGLVSYKYLTNDKIELAFKKTPDLLILINPNENRSVIHEANCLNIPIIAFTDTNTNLLGITYPIPVNNNSIYFIFNSIIKSFSIIKKYGLMA